MLPEQDKLIEDLYHQYFTKLTLYARARVNDPEITKEIVQDTFHEAVLHIDIIMSHENPGGWLMTVVKNKIRESERTRNRYMKRFISLDSEALAAVIPSSEFSEPEDSSVEEIEQALTTEEYKLLKRLVFDRASHLEVAKEFGISVYASQKRLERIRGKLYKVFPDYKKRPKK